MNKAIALLILFPVLCFAGTDLIFNSTGQTSVEAISSDELKTSLAFSLQGLTLESASLNNQEFTRVLPLLSEIADFGFTQQEGLPNLPVYTDRVVIPDQSGVRVNILSAEYETYQDIDIAPAQPLKLESGEQELSFSMDETFYQQDAFYPSELVELSEPMIMRDFRFIQLTVNLAQYNPATKELRVYTNIDYELIYEGIDNRNIKVRRNNFVSEAFVPIYRSTFSNADFILTDYEVIKGGYLILSPNNLSFSDTIQTLARWKHLKGYYTYVARSDEIYPSGTPTYLQVYSYIEDAYNTWEIPPDYVLIVGDEDQRIPDYPYGGYPSDHQYSTVDGSDYISDILIARMSVDNLTELRTVMHKVLRYEQYPDMVDPGYWKRGLGVAGNIIATSPRIVNLWVRALAMQHGYTQVDTVFDWGGGAPNWSTLNTAINNGVSYVSYRGWAGPSGWYNPSYSVSNIYALSNGWKIGIMASIVCGTGDFGDSYSDPCFGEAWIRAGSPTFPRGGVSFYGSTDHGTHTAWNNPNMIGFFEALFEKGMYHFAQLMFMGKLRILETFPNGGSVNKYFNTYNSLGDPELEVRTEIPRPLTAGYLSTIPLGTNFLTVNVTESGFPFEGAYVNLVKGHGDNEEIFIGGWTDASGNITLSFENTVADTIFVTVTARDYTPHIGFCRSVSQAVALGVDSLDVDDDDSGGSSGNSDGNINPAETAGLDVSLHNFGVSQNATGISGILSSSDPRVNVTAPNQTYPNIAYGNSAFPNSQFMVDLDANIPHGEYILLNLAINSNEGSWDAVVPLEINSIKAVSIEVSYPGNSNNRLDPGETSDMVVSFVNQGGLNGDNITGVLSSSDPYITINDASGQFGNVAIGQTGDNSPSPFNITVSNDAFNGRNVNFTINFTSDMTDMDDVNFEKTFSVVVGNVSSFDPSGPDNYGYYMYDNTDLSYAPAPIYNWIEVNPYIGGNGARVNFSDTDDASALVTTPFNIVYYGQTYGHMIISTNGFAAFDTIPYDVAGNYWHNWDNWPIPDPGNARGQISPFWDDIGYSGGTNGVFTYHDVAGGRFIIEWSGFTHSRTGSPQTFEMIIYDPSMHPTPTGDCEIVFQYAVINNDDYNDSPTHPESYSSVGFENWDENDGLQYEYDNTYHPGASILEAGRAIKITTATGLSAPPDMSYTPTSFDLSCEPGEQVSGELIFTNDGEGYLYYSISPEMLDILQVRIPGTGNIPLSIPTEQSPVSEEPKIDYFAGPYNPPVILDEGGPDNFGYEWIDSDEPDGPVYNWIDITSIGTHINWPGDEDDGVITGIPIGFDFPFYENMYNTMNICTNGFISFTSVVTAFDNTNIPNSAAPNNLLAVYWDDLNFEPRGDAYYYNNGVDSCIVAYIGVPHFEDDGLFTFEVIIQSSGKITYQYQEASGPDINQETIGIENAGGNDGLQVCYNAAYVTPGLAVQFICERWLFVYPTSNVVVPNTSDTVIVTCDAAELSEGLYEGLLQVATNDPDYPSFNIPVHFSVGLIPSGYEYLPGDANMYIGMWPPIVIGSDVTYLVNYFRGNGNPCLLDDFWCSADANGDCNIIGSDVTKLINYFRGIGSVLHCADYEPVWLTPDDLPDTAPDGWPFCEPPPINSRIIPAGSIK